MASGQEQYQPASVEQIEYPPFRDLALDPVFGGVNPSDIGFHLRDGLSFHLSRLKLLLGRHDSILPNRAA
jgi:hypothetical protein